MELKFFLKHIGLSIPILLCLYFFSGFDIQAQPEPGTVCNCKEYVYVNERGDGSVHKFEVGADGSLVEINPTGPWYPDGQATELPSPHGLGFDLNGFLYIAENWNDDNADIRKLTCDGEIFAETDFQLNAQAFNITSIDNILLYNQVGGGVGTTFNFNLDYTSIESYDVCNGASVGTACFLDDQGNEVSTRWGFWQAYDQSLWAYGVDGGDFIYKFSLEDIQSSACISPLVAGAEGDLFNLNRAQVRGITTDLDGNIYIVNAQTFGGPAKVTKIDQTGTILAETPLDSDDGDGGWYGMVGLVFVESCNCLYSANFTTVDDCVTMFPLDLDPDNIVAAVGPVPGSSSNNNEAIEGKAIGKMKECCPDPLTQTIDQTYCDAAVGDRIFLNELFPCDGIVCGAEWIPDSGNTGMTYYDCEQSITITDAEACGTFNKQGANAQCGSFDLIFNVEVLIPVEVSVSEDQVICEDGSPEELSITTTATDIQWQESTTSCSEGFVNIDGATSTTYQPTSVSETTFYRAIVNVTGNCSSGSCPIESDCITITYNDVCTVCNCTEYIYLNDDDLGRVYKFEIDGTSGALTKVGDPLLDGLTKPHGLAADLNGFLYIGEQIDWDGQWVGPINKLTCDGEILDEDAVNTSEDDNFNANFQSHDGLFYTYNSDSAAVIILDPCLTGNQYLGGMSVPADIFSWGFHITDDGTWYLASRNTGEIFTGSTDPSLYDPNNSNSGTLLFNTNLSGNFNAMAPMGITLDADGNIFIVFNNLFGTNSSIEIHKYDQSGNLLASISDSFGSPNASNGVAGFGGARGIIYSPQQDLLYVSGVENCISIFDTDLNEEVALNIGNPIDGSVPKGLNILAECCPSPLVQTIDKTYCEALVGDKLFLNKLFPCEGTICGAPWVLGSENSGIDFNECEQSITITDAEACATFAKQGSNLQCGAFELTYNVEILTPVSVEVSADQAVCSNAAPEELSLTTTATDIQWQMSTTSCTDGFANIEGATSTTYQPAAITGNTYYKAIVNVSGNCSTGSCPTESACITITEDTECVETCTAAAGTLTADETSHCLSDDMTSVDLSATPNGDMVVPTDYEVTYVLTSNPGLVIEQVGASPSFTVSAVGDYIIHTLVAETSDAASSDYLDLSGVVLGTTTAVELLPAIEAVCASLDADGAPISVNESAMAVLPCDDGTIDLIAEDGFSSYQWYKDGVLVDAADGGTNQTLTISEAGEYIYTVDGADLDSGCGDGLCCPTIISTDPDCTECGPIKCLNVTVTKN